MLQSVYIDDAVGMLKWRTSERERERERGEGGKTKEMHLEWSRQMKTDRLADGQTQRGRDRSWWEYDKGHVEEEDVYPRRL